MRLISITLLIIVSGYCKAQTGIQKRNVNSSAIMDLSNSTNKAFLPPRVSLSANLFDTTTPVLNPVEGLIVYNIGAAQLPGFYIWNKGVWSLLATKDNSVLNSVVTLTTPSSILLTTAGIYIPVIAGNLSFNSIPGVSYTAGTINLPAGNYNIQITLNLNATTETVAAGIGSSSYSTNAHYYSAKLVTPSLNNLGGIVVDNVSSNTSSTTNSKLHTANFSFTFRLATADSFIFNLAHATGGTFTGSVNIVDGFIHIQKSVL